MEQKNENRLLSLKNYSNFLLDIGLNVSFSQLNDVKVEKGKMEEKFRTIEEVDYHIKEWQINI